MKPTLIINGHDYTEYVEELAPSSNGLDADGSGRDVKTGLMYRIPVAVKLKFSAKMLRMPETLVKQLYSDVSGAYYSARVLNPQTNTVETHTFYTQAVPFGTQRYLKKSNKTVYDGVSFEMTER